MPDRVVVFIDAQNMYKVARYAFFDRNDYHIKGQFHPLALGQTLASRGKPGSDRILQEVRIYTGRPDSTKQPKSYAAHMKQCAGWTTSGVTVVPRMLRYPSNWPREKEREKGIDVVLAIDFVTMAIEDEYDVGILASVDTDLAPALQYVAKKCPTKTVEVAAWRSDWARGRLSVRGMNVWCHWLDLSTHNMLIDITDYDQ